MKIQFITILILMTTQTQYNWIDKNLYSFQSKYLTIDNQQMHYIDEGEGETILWIHGTPSWSFLYRDMIKAFSKKHRNIAIDHIGFGLSDKPIEYDYSAKKHADNLEEFINKMNLKNITLVVHDFGGPIGLSYAIKHSENIKKVVLFNTWLWETKEDKNVQKVDKILHNFIGKFLYKQMNFSPKFLLKQAFYDKKKLSKKVHKHYINVFPKSKDRTAPLEIGYSLLGDSDWYGNLWKQITKIEDKDVLIIWGTEDSFFQETHLQKWTDVFNNHQLLKLKSGHFPQEEFPKEVNEAIKQFIE